MDSTVHAVIHSDVIRSSAGKVQSKEFVHGTRESQADIICENLKAAVMVGLSIVRAEPAEGKGIQHTHTTIAATQHKSHPKGRLRAGYLKHINRQLETNTVKLQQI
jgi:hypothetical protein